jgi:sortase (surface protein transpeptidase)
MRRPRPAIAVLLISVGALIATPLVVAGTSTSTEVESVGERPISQEAPAPARYVPGAPQFTFERVTTTTSEPAPVPVQLRIPAISVDAEITPSGVAKDGQAEVPDDVMQIGWYRFGNRPGDGRGATVLIAHRDGRVEGPGVFYDLGTLNVDDRIMVTDEAGTRHEYRVVSREAIDKALLPAEELFTREGDPQLVLISCGGEFVPNAGGYQSNVVVIAQPTGGKE